MGTMGKVDLAICLHLFTQEAWECFALFTCPLSSGKGGEPIVFIDRAFLAEPVRLAKSCILTF